MPDDNKDKLNGKLTGLREKEVEMRSRAAELANAMSERSLNTEEKAELTELETNLSANQEEQRNIQSVLKIGNYSDDINKPIDMEDRDLQNFSVVRLIRANARGATHKDREAAQLEMEASAEVERKIGVAPRGAYIPMDVLGEWRGPGVIYDPTTQKWERRDLTADSFSAAGAFIGVDFRPGQMIPLLRNSMALTRAGVTFLDGLVGDVAFPKHTGAASAGWVGRDGGTIGESEQTVGMVTLTPRTLGVYTDYSRQLRLQSSVSVENFIRQDLMTIMALEKDRAGIHGSGTSGEPVGVENTTGIGTQSFSTTATPTRSEVIGMRTDLASANALLNQTQSYITNSTVYGNLLDTAVDSGSGRFLLDENGRMIGRPVIESNQIQANEMYFGNWGDLLIGTWGGLDMLVDPYSGATSGTTRVLVFQSCDMAVRHAESFCKGS